MFRRNLSIVVMLVGTCCSAAHGQDTDEHDRHPIPDATALEASSKLVREIYGPPLTAAKSEAEKRGLLAKMMTDLGRLDDPTDQYAVLTEASKLAVNLGDVPSIQRIVGSLTETFEIDKVKLLSDSLLAVRPDALSAPGTKTWCESMLAVADNALRQRKIDIAARLLAAVSKELAKLRDKSLSERHKELTSLSDALNAIAEGEAAGRKILEDKPGDSQAILAVAQSTILLRNDWAEAFELLKRADDPSLVKVAELELTLSGNTDETLALADGWRAIARSATGMFQATAARRAQEFYEQVLPDAKGLQRAQVQKRLEEVKDLQPRDYAFAAETRPASKPRGLTFVLVRAGKFSMGSRDSASKLAREYSCSASEFAQEVPLHSVTISHEFYISAHEVTVRSFRQFVTATKYKTDAERRGGINRGGDGSILRGLSWRNPGYRQTDDHPVVAVSWNDAKAFCEWLSSKEKATIRLPTEAEWEYAARAGTDTRFVSGENEATLRQHANLSDESAQLANPGKMEAVPWNDGFAATAPVGSFRPNSWGLYDMTGNAWEWCEDIGSRKFTTEAIVDPLNASGGEFRSVRGGSFDTGTRHQRVSRRGVLPASEAHANQGFRVVRLAD